MLRIASPAVVAPGTLATLLSWGMFTGVARRRQHRQRVHRAMHELRRPLQALLLVPEVGSRRPDAALTALDLALVALGDLESLLEGGSHRPLPESGQSWARLVEDAAERWRQAAWLRGGGITVSYSDRLDHRGLSRADAVDLARALDNLIVNALIHGGPQIDLRLVGGAGAITISVSDSGTRGRTGSACRNGHRGVRSGHGIAIVEEIVALRGGRFRLHRDGRGTVAELHLPAGSRS